MEYFQRQKLVDERASAWAEAVELLTVAANEGRAMSTEENEKHERLCAQVDSIDKTIKSAERHAAIDQRHAEIDAENAERRAFTTGTSIEQARDEVRDYEEAFTTYAVQGREALTAEQRQALEARLAEQRAQGVLTGAGGGYAAPAGFWSKITETMLFYGGMMEVGVETITTNTGNPLSWPTNDDTSNTGSWVGENAGAGTSTDVSFGARTLSAHILTSGVHKVSLSYLQDVDPVAAEGFLTRALGRRNGRALNTALTTGSGVGRPYGIINGLSTGKTTSSATAITYAELIDLEHSVDRDYRTNARYMMHDLILAYTRKIVDSNGMPVYQVSYRVGEPDSINGRPLVVNNDMDSTVATTKKTVAFGDFRSSYVYRTVSGGQVMRLTERYAEDGQVGFVTFSRHDGLVQDSSAVKLLVQA